MQKAKLGRVYVWEIPVRFYHWLNALCILVLCVTGYLIGQPLAIQRAWEPTNSSQRRSNNCCAARFAYVKRGSGE